MAVAVAVLLCFDHPDGAASCGLLLEETLSDCFEECRDFRAAHRLMGELDAVGLGLDGVGE